MSASGRTWILSVEDRTKLIQGAIEGKKGNYSPYSNFPVGAALLIPEGQIIKGANVENASYGGTICAERTAMVKAVSEGNRSFIGLAVVTNVPAAVTPCGMCRQFMREFCALDMPVLLVPGDYPQINPPKPDPTKPGRITEGGVRETTMGALLPDSFGPGELELPRMP
ncbi:hypothetical protein APHAL10511_000700 [Amanita phalloides]|nr:hypothetical protein APHAL10511_000700 [Amanita phalloides]